MKKHKIFLVLGGQATNVGGSKIWVKNLYDPLVRLGHEVTLLDIDEFATNRHYKPMSLKFKNILNEELPKIFINAHEKNKFDIFFSYLHNGQIDPAVIGGIKKSVFTINYTTNPHQFSMYEEIAKVVDLNIGSHPSAKEKFNRINSRYYFMPFAANPDFYKPSTGNKIPGPAFIGAPYGIRPYWFWRVLQNGIDLKIFGPGWRLDPKKRNRRLLRNIYLKFSNFISDSDQSIRFYDSIQRQTIIQKLNTDFPQNLFPAVKDDQYSGLLSQYSIIINISESRKNHDILEPEVILGCNLREFETTMSGTLLLTEYSDTLNDFFEDGKEVVSFTNELDLTGKLKYFINNTNEREKIAHAGYLRALKDHTWQNRFEKLFNDIII